MFYKMQVQLATNTEILDFNENHFNERLEFRGFDGDTWTGYKLETKRLASQIVYRRQNWGKLREASTILKRITCFHNYVVLTQHWWSL